ncbi:MAG: hypothetical protein JSW37_07140, partial [Anaerolineales bacterium]
MALRLVGGLLLLIVLVTTLVVVAGFGGVWTVYAYYSQQVPSAEEIGQSTISSFKTTKIYDRTGEHLLYELLPPEGGDRTIV